MSNIGLSLPRLDAELQVCGKSRYGADVDMPGMLQCKIKRSERAHARIIKIDITAALAWPGVVDIILADDFVVNRYGITTLDQQFMADTVVRGYYDAVAAVAAASSDIAEQACRLIKVEYEDLPPLFDPLEALREDSYKIHGGSNLAATIRICSGDIEDGFAHSDFIFQQSFSTPANEQAPIEPHAGIAYLDEINGDLVVRTSVQRPAVIVPDVALALGRPRSKTRVISGAVGGGFGGKNEVSFEAIISLLALRTGKPVKIEFTREDEFNCTTVRHPYQIKMKSGVSKSGKLLAREVQIISDCGPYVCLGKMTLEKAAIHACGPYIIPNMLVYGQLVYTNNCVGGAMRGFGVPQMGFAYEVHTDYIARQMGLDPLEFRRLNLIVDGSRLPTGMSMDTVTVRQTMHRAMEMARERGDY